jgi:hypothetical protein
VYNSLIDTSDSAIPIHAVEPEELDSIFSTLSEAGRARPASMLLPGR